MCHFGFLHRVPVLLHTKVDISLLPMAIVSHIVFLYRNDRYLTSSSWYRHTMTHTYKILLFLSALYRRFQPEKVYIFGAVIEVSEENGGGPFW